MVRAGMASNQLAGAALLAWMVVQATVSATYTSSPSYYWSKPHLSHRAHIGPPPRVNHLMTEWSRWGQWARCSRSCGGGVRTRTRTCITTYPRVMPGSGIRTSHDACAGDSVEYSVCGVRQCPPGQVSALSFRAAQCRHYNNRRVFGRVVNNWVPYTQGGINPCALVCEGEGEGIVYTFGKVTDGTHCRTDENTDGLCVNGRCLRLSCDGRLGGVAREDMCRVCGGNNETCTRHTGVFHTHLPAADQPPQPRANTPQATPKNLGYYEVSFIPQGATNVKVKDASPNFLALKSGSKYMLNGDWLIDWPGEVDAGGTSFTYTRAEDESESLTALGPTTEDLSLMVLLREHNPGIHYEYWTPNTPGHEASPIIVPLSTTTTSTTTTIPPPPPTTTTTTTTTTSTARPAVLTSLNVTRLRRPPLKAPLLRRPAGKRPTTRRPLRKRPAYHPARPYRPHTTRHDPDATYRLRKIKKPIKKPRKKVVVGVVAAEKTTKSEVEIVESPREVEEDEERRRNEVDSDTREEERGKSKVGKGKEEKPQRRRKKKRKKKKRPQVPASCGPCERPRRAKKEFCTSDFVSRVEVLGSGAVGGEMRYEVLVHQSYKNKVPLLHKEFLWVDNDCLCPKLRHGRSYLVMGATEVRRGREVRLVLRNGSYARRYSPRNLARILRIRHNEMRYCRPWRRDVRFLLHKDTNNANATVSLADTTAVLIAPNATARLVT